MSWIRRICRSLARRTRRADVLLASGVAAPTAPGQPAVAATRLEQAPTAARLGAGGDRVPNTGRAVECDRRRRTGPFTMIAAGLLPRTIQLCIHCQQRPAGFWVRHTGGTVVRRPWCLSCCQQLDRDRFDVIPFGG